MLLPNLQLGELWLRTLQIPRDPFCSHLSIWGDLMLFITSTLFNIWNFLTSLLLFLSAPQTLLMFGPIKQSIRKEKNCELIIKREVYDLWKKSIASKYQFGFSRHLSAWYYLLQVEFQAISGFLYSLPSFIALLGQEQVGDHSSLPQIITSNVHGNQRPVHGSKFPQ